MDVLARLDEARRETNVLEHPFYQRWSSGELSAGELSLYADQYRHAVMALAEASSRAAAAASPTHRPGLARHAAEEGDHVGLWDRFAAETQAREAENHRAGANHSGGSPLHQTAGCVAAWTAGEDLLEHLAVLYAVEASQPEISRTKLEGLVDHYGYTPEGPALEYFELHERLDVEHSREAAALIRELLAGREDSAQASERMVCCARAALTANWELLSGVEAAAG
jgi:pyrroloquinoline-quinone synthase